MPADDRYDQQNYRKGRFSAARGNHGYTPLEWLERNSIETPRTTL